MSYSNAIICWKGQGPPGVPPSEVCRRLRDGEACDGLELLPIDEVAAQVCRVFKGVERSGDLLSWSYGGALHQVHLNPYFFLYDYPIDQGDYTQAASFESTNIPLIAGRLGCVVYYPRSDYFLERPIGSAVREPKLLQSTDGAVQLPVSIFEEANRPYMTETAATFNSSAEQLEARTGLVFEDNHDSLDFCKMALLQVGDYKYLLNWHRDSVHGVYVWISDSVDSFGDAVDSLMVALNLTSADIRWTPDRAKFIEYELWRQDDNGNQVLIEKTPCRADALDKVRMFTARGHKQLYWAQPVTQEAP